ncbi:hypothetical protein JCGZ_07487 [Jatropha curcas]|uniref:Uncharacterized protein n=1 Tax=Jatropha curcas TaxID=180498 RepID=A0A067KCG7_JATCU|nr:hypothetical protein JCGZ_07487 [Jatropha curcas]
MSTERHSNSPSTSPDDDALFLDILHEAPLCGHRKRRSIFGAVVYCLLLASYAALGALAPFVFDHKLVPSLLCSCDVVLLIVTVSLQNIFWWHDMSAGILFEQLLSLYQSSFLGIFQQYFVSQVQKIRLQGYYSFSQKLKHIVRLPFAITANCCNAACHGMETPNQLSFDLCIAEVWKLPIFVLCILVIVLVIVLTEAICAVSFMTVYIGYLHQYNSLDSQPDILKSLYSPLQQSSSLEGLRYHDGGRLSDQQMALLQYQRENLHFLSEEILRLQECLSKYERSNDGSTPQVDLAHMLAAREQELRTLSAEMNQLQTELRLARSLIAERDAEVQRVRTTNNQYVEENERLRAILGEWSTRAAKLERALEVEQLSNLELQKKLSASRGHWGIQTEQSEQRTA